MTDRRRIDSVLTQLQSWTDEDRVALANEILKQVHNSHFVSPPRDTLSRALGMLRGDGPAPTDDEVKRIVDEARSAKYGR